MNLPPLLLLLHFIFFIQINGQNPTENTEPTIPNTQDSASNFQPSLAVVIGMLAIMFSLTFILILYAKFCHRAASVHTLNTQIHDGLARSLPSGLDKTVVESLPIFTFSSLRGSRDGLDCAVCLAKFEDVEVLRLLPRCKHAFHMDCIDTWLEKHSTCPLCRRKVSADDLLHLQSSSSLRFLYNNNNNNNNILPPADQVAQDIINLELYVEREESHHGSSRFCIGSSFRKVDEEEEEQPLPESLKQQSLHRFNHKIVVADAVLKNRWSNVSSSDIMFLNSEMLNEVSCARPSLNSEEREGMRENDEMMSIKEEMERKRVFESKMRDITSSEQNRVFGVSSSSSSVMNPNEKRSMSEIVVHPRFGSFEEINVKDERRRRLWLPIARKTVQWFANRERRSPQSHQQRLKV